MAGEHNVTIRYVQTYGEYVTDCSCGWVGSYWKSKMSALNEAKRHQGDDDA